MDRIEFADHTDMAFHNIEEVTAGGHPLLRIKALIFHSSIVADHVDLYHELDAVQILIAAATTRLNKSGLVELYIPIPERIQKVTFGKNKTVIWQRGTARTLARNTVPAAEHAAESLQ